MKRFFIAIIAAIMCTISAKAQVNLGQIYDKGGVKGLVAYVDESGQHGLLLSLQESDKNWLADMSLEMETNAFYEDDGMKNMEAIAKYIADNNLSWDKFPLFEWARSLGDGWYVPSRGELNMIWKALNGGNLDFNKKACKLWKAYNKTVEKAGGDSFFCSNFSTGGVFKMLAGMISSTEAEGGKVYTINTEKGKNLVNHPMGAPNVKIVEYRLKKNAHRSEGDPLAAKRVLHFDARAVHKF
jgi:hypothetical protein